MSGSGNNKITSVLGASTISATASGVLASQHAQNTWVFATMGLTIALALLAITLKMLSVASRKNK